MSLVDRIAIRLTEGRGGQLITAYGFLSLCHGTAKRSFGATTEVPFGIEPKLVTIGPVKRLLMARPGQLWRCSMSAAIWATPVVTPTLLQRQPATRRLAPESPSQCMN